MLFLNNFELLPDQKIIRAHDYAQFAQGGKIVELARKEAARIAEEAKLAYEAERQRGFEEGQVTGKAQIADKMIECTSKIRHNLKAFEGKLVDILIQALRQVIGDIDKKELIIGVVSKALQVVRSQKRVLIRVSSADLSHVEDEINAFLERFPSIDFLDVNADERLRPGDCMLETDVGIVDARLDQQLVVIKNSFERWSK